MPSNNFTLRVVSGELCVVCCVLENTRLHLEYPPSRFRYFFYSIHYALCIFSNFRFPRSTFRIPHSAFPIPYSHLPTFPISHLQSFPPSPFRIPHSPFSPSQPPTFSLFPPPPSIFPPFRIPLQYLKSQTPNRDNPKSETPNPKSITLFRSPQYQTAHRA